MQTLTYRCLDFPSYSLLLIFFSPSFSLVKFLECFHAKNSYNIWQLDKNTHTHLQQQYIPVLALTFTLKFAGLSTDGSGVTVLRGQKQE